MLRLYIHHIDMVQSSTISIRLDASAVARAAHEFAHGSPLCSAAEHFPGSNTPHFEPLHILTSSDSNRRRQHCCGVCAHTAAPLWHCDRCWSTWCTTCLRSTSLQQLCAERRMRLLHECDAEQLPRRASTAGTADVGIGAWPATDKRGRIFAWFLWTGDNPMPAYLQLCIDSFAHVAGEHVCVRVVRPSDLRELFVGCAGCVSADGQLSALHPAYESLSLVHRADYLRCELLHRYGGLYADCDTICCSGLGRAVDALHECAAVLPGAALLHEAGMNVGLFRRGSELTRCWRDALRARLDVRQVRRGLQPRTAPPSMHTCSHAHRETHSRGQLRLEVGLSL